MTLLYVVGSPRGELSRGAQVAEAYLAAYRAAHPGAVVDTLDLWKEKLPEFDGDRAAAKMSFFGGPAMTGEQQSAWDGIVALVTRFKSADDYLFTVPMWNSGIPYRLKLFIDLVTQPGLLFGFDPQHGYSGLLEGKRATAIYTSGVYGPGAPAQFGRDFHSTYFEDWLNFIGVAAVTSIRYQPTLLTADPAAGLAAARAQAEAAARGTAA